MPKKLLSSKTLPTLVEERLHAWGLCIKTLRITQKIKVKDLCQRLQITHTTLRRLEKGDTGAGAGLYLNALMVLGALETLAPLPPPQWLNATLIKRRVQTPQPNKLDDDF